MSVVAAGSVSLVLSRLQSLVAACTAWQAWCGAADAVEALGHTHVAFVDPDTLAIGDFPYVVANHGEAGLVFEAMGTEADGSFGWLGGQSGELSLLVVDVVAEEHVASAQDAELAFGNRLGELIEGVDVDEEHLSGLQDVAGTGEHLVLSRIAVGAPMRSQAAEGVADGREYMACELRLSVGGGR